MRLVLILPLLASPVLTDQGGGTLNPEAMTINRVLSDIADGQVSMMACAAGFRTAAGGMGKGLL